MTTPASQDSSTSVAAPISLYEAIGGQPAIAAAVDVFYSRMLSDPDISPFFPGGVGTRHRRHLATVLGEALGGPERYRGPDLAKAHNGRGIADLHFNKTAGHLAGALTELGVPDDLVARIIDIVATLRPIVVTA